MSLLHLIAALGHDSSAGAPSLVSLGISGNTLGSCPVTGWAVEYTAVLDGDLQDGQELYWEHATNAAGDNWSYFARGTDLSDIYSNTTIGSDGDQGSTTVYSKMRVYVVPDWGDSGDAIDGPSTSVQSSRTAQLCSE